MKAKLYALAITLFMLGYALQAAAPAGELNLEKGSIAVSPQMRFSQPPLKVKKVEKTTVQESAATSEAKRIEKKKIPKQAKVEAKLMAVQDKSPLVAALLAFFLGYLGVHRFYLGYTWQGVVQFFTLGGFGVWYIIDLIRILVGDLKEKE